MIELQDIREDEAAVCRVPSSENDDQCNCSTCSQSRITVQGIEKRHRLDGKTDRRNVRAFLMFAIACVTSPCCTPLIVPLGLVLLAGTPVAAWIGHNVGWVYGGLTLISLVTAVMGMRWLRPGNIQQQPSNDHYPVPVAQIYKETNP